MAPTRSGSSTATRPRRALTWSDRVDSWHPTVCISPIARAGVNGCPNTVIITDLNGNLVASLPAGVGWNVGWSPNASRVATWLAAEGEIGVYGIDGAREAVLHLPDGYCVCGDHDPVWSPDGASLLLPMSRNRPSRRRRHGTPDRRRDATARSRRRPALESAGRLLAGRGSRRLHRLHRGTRACARQALPGRFGWYGTTAADQRKIVQF